MQPSAASITNELPSPFSFSQSSLQDYSDCPRRFQLRYLEKLSWPAVESEPVAEYERRQQEGRQFHRLVQQHLLGLPPERLAELAPGPNLPRWWQNYLSVDFGMAGSTFHTEFSLSSPLGEHRLLAKYDLVAIRDEEAVIYDWKTYARRPRDESLAARWQTRVYRALLARAGSHLSPNLALDPKRILMLYWFADFPSEPARFRYDPGQLRRDWSALETIVAEISSAKDFPLTDDRNMCRFCVFRSYCGRGQVAGNLRESEDESEGTAAFDLDFEQIGEVEF
jgi:hypothetical protein